MPGRFHRLARACGRRAARLATASFLIVATAMAAGAGPEGPFSAPAVLNAGGETDAHDDEGVRLATDGKGVWVAVWQVRAASDLGLGRDSDIVFARSPDGGKTWTAPSALSEGFASDRGEDKDPAIATDGDGRWMVVWSSTEGLDGSTRRDRDIHVAVSQDDAVTWTAVRALNTNAAGDWGDDERPSVAVDGRGRWMVVWQSSDSLGNTKGGDRDILFATSTDRGASWSDPAVVDAAAKSDDRFDDSPRIAVDASSRWMVVWSSGGLAPDRPTYERNLMVASSADGGLSWSTPVNLADSGSEDRPDWGPRIAADRKGNWICAWASSDSLGDTIGYDRDILFVRSSDGGRTWTERAPLDKMAATDAGDDGPPELVVDPSGTWMAVWPTWEKRGHTLGADADLFYSVSTDAGATWSYPSVVNTNATTDHGEDLDPSLATDGKGRWIVAWDTNETARPPTSMDRDLLIAVGDLSAAVVGPVAPPKRD